MNENGQENKITKIIFCCTRIKAFCSRLSLACRLLKVQYKNNALKRLTYRAH